MPQVRAATQRRNASSAGLAPAPARAARPRSRPGLQAMLAPRRTRLAALVALAIASAPSAFATTYTASVEDNGSGTVVDTFSYAIAQTSANPGTNDTVVIDVVGGPLFSIFGATLPKLTAPLTVESSNSAVVTTIAMVPSNTPLVYAPAPLTTSGSGDWILGQNYSFIGQVGANGTANAAAGAGLAGFALNGSLTNNGGLTGGTGGIGAADPAANATGGAGGNGGAGLVLDANSTLVNDQAIFGGSGGFAGAAPNGTGGAGGSGGAGVYGNNSTLINNGTISGGAPAPGGEGSQIGVAGVGGVGVEGQSLTIIDSGTIEGDGSAADSLLLTGGNNTLTLLGTQWILTGNIGLQGGASLTFNQNTAQTLNVSVTGNGSIVQNGSGNLTLANASSYTGGTVVQSGTLITGTTDVLPANGSVVVASTGTLDLNNQSQAIGSLGGSGAVLLGSGNLTVTAGASLLTPTLAAMPLPRRASAAPSTAATAAAAFNGVIQGSGGLIVNGGTQSLGGVNQYTGATVIGNAGTLALAGAGSIATSSAVRNDGTFNLAAANGDVTVQNYTQAANGTLVLGVTSSTIQQLHVDGTATLAGALELYGTSTTYADGLHPLLSATAGINGSFGSVYGGGTLQQGYVLVLQNVGGALELLLSRTAPLASDTNASTEALAAALQTPFTLASSALNNDLNSDCDAFDTGNVCLGAAGRYTVIDSSGPHEAAAMVFGGYRVDTNLRVGGWADQGIDYQAHSPLVSTDSTNPIVGAYGVWTQDPGSDGYAVRVAAGFGDRTLTLTRPRIGTAEPGSGTSTLKSTGVTAVVRYDHDVEHGWVVAPYAGVRYTDATLGGYTEQLVQGTTGSPLTYGDLSEKFVTALVGTGFHGPLGDRIDGSASVGIEQDLYSNTGSATVTNADIGQLNAMSLSNSTPHLRPALAVGASYAIDRSQRIGIGLNYSQQPYDTHGVTSTEVDYMAWF